MATYTDVFGGSTVQPTDVGFSAVALTDSILTYWPPYATTGQVLSRIMKVNATVASKTITLPDATLVGEGQDILFDGAGAETFTVLDFDGSTLGTVEAGQVKYFYLSDNTTQAGTWRITLFGVGSSSLDAAQLAGYGLSAIGSTLNAAPVVTVVAGSATVVAADRAKLHLWTGGSGTLTLPTTVGSTSDFVIEVRNQGTGTLTLAPVGGALIDGSASITLSVQESCFVHMGLNDWHTVGRGRNTAFNFTQLVKSTTGGTTTLTLTEASNVVQKYTGVLVSNATIVLPAVVQVYYVSNETSGLYTTTFSCAAGGSTVQVTQNQAAILFCDGTNIVNANTSLQGGISTLQFGPGSVTAPSVAFNEVATGFYQSGSHKIGVTINGVFLGEFDSNGFNGALNGTLGATTPASAVVTTLTASGATTLDGTTIPASSTLLTTLTGAPINNPTFTGAVNAPTPALLDDSTLVATTAWVQDTVPAAVVTYYTSTVPPSVSAAYAPLASPALTGVPTAPTATTGTSTTQLATTAFAYNNFAPVASPAFTGIPTAPTASPGTSTTQLATTAFAAGLAFSAALPNQTGNAGKIVTTDGSSASWTAVKTVNNASILTTGNIDIVGTGGTTSTASIALTASSPAAMSVTPATPGLYVTLPDATTCTKADNLYSIYNAGDYDYGVKDSAGTQLGWIRARTGAMIGLADNATAAGVWAYYGLEKTGITASYVNSTLANMGSTIRRIALDANRTCFLFGGTDCYAIVYDASTQTWGSATLVRASVGSGAFLGVLAATDKVLVCSCSSTTAFEAVTLSISTTTVTVNTGTKATATLAGSWASFGQLITVGTSWVVSYGRATTTSAIRAITVSGTTPTIGAESAITTAVAQSATLFASGSVVRTICQGSGGTSVLCTPYTVSGSTLTLGTQATAPATNAANRSFLNGNGNIVCHYINTTHYATIFKLTGTTEAASSVSLGTAPGSMPTQADCLVVSASKTVFAAMDTADIYFNILTDTAGTASAGTQITFAHGGSAIVGVYGAIASGNTARFGYASVSSNGTFGAVTVDCSAASPVMGAVQNLAYVSGVSDTWGMYPAASDKYGVRAFTNLICGTSISINLSGGGTSYSDWGVTINSLVIRTPLFIPCGARSVSTLNFGVTGASANESWCNGMNNVGGTIGQQIYRVEAAA